MSPMVPQMLTKSSEIRGFQEIVSYEAAHGDDVVDHLLEVVLESNLSNERLSELHVHVLAEHGDVQHLKRVLLVQAVALGFLSAWRAEGHHLAQK